jgi:GNAT superfamily N-acetyltransferase
MGHVIGDGGWYFHIADMAVLPEHQRRGIGDAVLTWLVDRIRAHAPTDPYITLLADEPGRPLYTRHGFVPTAPYSIGMKLTKR